LRFGCAVLVLIVIFVEALRLPTKMAIVITIKIERRGRPFFVAKAAKA